MITNLFFFCDAIQLQLGYGSTTEDIGDEVGEMSTVGFVNLGAGRKAARVKVGYFFTGVLLLYRARTYCICVVLL